MGNGVSSISNSERENIARNLRLYYESLVSKGIADDAIQQLMVAKYNEVLKVSSIPSSTSARNDNSSIKSVGATKPPTTNYASDSKPISTTPYPPISSDKAQIYDRFGKVRRSLDASTLKKTGAEQKVLNAFQNKSQGPSRRRSFGMAANEKNRSNTTLADNEGNLAAAVAQSIADAAKAGADSWDSVIQQPRCAICNMIFTTELKKERHLKYSDYHIKNTQLHETKKNSDNITTSSSHVTVVAESKDNNNTIIEMKSFEDDKDDITSSTTSTSLGELIYYGTKFFWRTRDDIEIHIYNHSLANCIEIIPCEVNSNLELNRVYLKRSRIVRLLGNTVVEDKMAELIELKKNDVNNNNLEVQVIDKTKLRVEAKRIVIASFILTRLQLSNQIAEKKIIVYESLAGDDPNILPLLTTPVANLHPVVIARRRKTTTSDVAYTIERLSKAQEELSQATVDAEKFSHLLASTSITNMLANSQMKK